MSHVRLHKTGKVIRACGHQRNAPKSVMHVPSSCFCFIKIITFHVDMRNYPHLVWPDAAQSWKKSLTLKWLTESIVLVGPSPRSYSFTPTTVRTHVHTHRNQQKPIEIWRSSVWVVLSRLSQPLPSGVCTWLSSRALRATRFTAQLPVYTTHNKLSFPQKNLHRHCLIVLFLLTWTTGTGWFVFFFFDWNDCNNQERLETIVMQPFCSWQLVPWAIWKR